jgi:hypothetical protein
MILNITLSNDASIVVITLIKCVFQPFCAIPNQNNITSVCWDDSASAEILELFFLQNGFSNVDNYA